MGTTSHGYLASRGHTIGVTHHSCQLTDSWYLCAKRHDAPGHPTLRIAVFAVHHQCRCPWMTYVWVHGCIACVCLYAFVARVCRRGQNSIAGELKDVTRGGAHLKYGKRAHAKSCLFCFYLFWYFPFLFFLFPFPPLLSFIVFWFQSCAYQCHKKMARI